VPFGRLCEEVFGIVKEIDIHFLELEPPQRPLQLVGEKLWVDAVPASVGVLHHLREGSSALLVRPRHRKRLPLHVADLGDDNELFASMAGEYVSDAGLTRAVGIVGGCVDEIDATKKRPFQGRGVFGGLSVDPVAAEAE
jgi:hypothetical protein